MHKILLAILGLVMIFSGFLLIVTMDVRKPDVSTIGGAVAFIYAGAATFFGALQV